MLHPGVVRRVKGGRGRGAGAKIEFSFCDVLYLFLSIL